jgi:MFS family permease
MPLGTPCGAGGRSAPTTARIFRLPTASPAPPGRAEQVGTRIVFLISGVGMSAWAPLVPFAKARADLGDGALGLLLLCLGAGSMITMPLAGALSTRAGCRAVIVASTVTMACTLPMLATASSVAVLVAALLLFGAAVGAIDVAMNIQALIVERAAGRAMMSGFHGLFSLGGIVGAAGVTAALGAGLSPLFATLAVVAVLAAALALAVSGLLPYGSERRGPAFAIPHGVVLLIGSLCFIAFLAEGAMLDWSAVLLTSSHGVGPSIAGLGYAAFSAAMTVGRLTGDRVVARVGGPRTIVVGATAAAAGIALAAVAPAWPAALAGFALVGIGCANVVPVLFSAAGRQTDMPEATAMPAIMTVGYAGLLAGPALMGFVSHATSLPIAFVALAASMLVVAMAGRLVRT